jgi:hypothetical protein
MVYMPSKKITKKVPDKPLDTATNDRLRELIEGAGLKRVEALALYNKGLHVLARCSDHSWKSYFSKPGTDRWRHVRHQVLQHAEKVFGPLVGKG